MSDFETEFPLLLANAGFAIAVDDTRIATVAIASIAKVVVFVFILLYSFPNDTTEPINLLLNLVKGVLF
jgi:hypothetical protein